MPKRDHVLVQRIAYVEYCISATIKFNSLPFTYDRAYLRCNVKTTSPKFIVRTITMLSRVTIELG